MEKGDRISSVLIFDERKTILTVVSFEDGGRDMSGRKQAVSRN